MPGVWKIIMTLVCCWLDTSYSRRRITAIADLRAAVFRTGNWQPLSDQTIKLFRVPVKCHRLEELDTDTGSWRSPYYSTDVGIGFAGYCFEAMTIIALFSRAMEQLVSEGGEPRPHPERIVDILARIATSYFASHGDRETQRVQFMLFSFCKKGPWIARMKFVPDRPPEIFPLQPLVPDRVHVIGEANDIVELTEATLEKSRRARTQSPTHERR